VTALSAPWRAALEEAWTAYCEGSYAIGACIADEQGTVLSRGRNRLGEARQVHGTAGSGFVAGHDLAHAEINALLDLQVKRQPECYGWTVYTTVEPCPQCAGAVAMSSIRGLSYAAPDPWAGAADILTDHRYVSRKGIRVSRAPADLQSAALRLVLTCFLESGHQADGPFIQSFEAHAEDLNAARTLVAAGTLARLRERRACLDEVLEVLRHRP
jgi:tRNA(Arg) A34 adenosine deaminase TadA